MLAVAASDPPLDVRWLEAVAEACRRAARPSPRLVDVFLEQRLELRVVGRGGAVRTEEVRSEGSAVRWAFPRRTVVAAATGVGSRVAAALLGRFGAVPTLPPLRSLAAQPLDVPRPVRAWALATAGRSGGPPLTVRFVQRRAVVVTGRGWSDVRTPPLVAVHADGLGGGLLAVADRPELERWLGDLLEPPPARAAAPTPGTRLPVLFRSGSGGAVVHELLGHLLESDLLVDGLSPLAGLGGATVTAAELEVMDDPLRDDLPGAFTCDDEGEPARTLPLVSRGVLCGVLADREGAHRLGVAAGRGRRSAWGRPPVPRLSNLVVRGAAVPAAELEARLGDALVVTRVGGAAVDPVAGRLVVRVERGWEVRHGRRRRPLAPFALTGTAVDVLTGIAGEVGDDPEPERHLGWCVKGGDPLPTGAETPSLVLGRLEVL